mgnify:CR=1 FL=1
MTSEGMGMQADWIAMSRMTLKYPPLAMAPTRRVKIFCDMQVQYTGVGSGSERGARGCASMEESGDMNVE